MLNRLKKKTTLNAYRYINPYQNEALCYQGYLCKSKSFVSSKSDISFKSYHKYKTLKISSGLFAKKFQQHNINLRCFIVNKIIIETIKLLNFN